MDALFTEETSVTKLVLTKKIFSSCTGYTLACTCQVDRSTKYIHSMT